MTDGEALLAAIRATPDDDTPRLVYADWLDDNGQVERAAFIREQIKIARAMKPAKGPQREPAYRFIEWPGVAHEFTRGFVEHVTCLAADWLAHGDAIIAAHPVRRVRLTTVPEIVVTGENAGSDAYWYQLADPDGTVPGHNHGLWFGRGTDERAIPAALLADRWPVVTFELPPPTRIMYATLAERMAAIRGRARIAGTWPPTNQPIVGDRVLTADGRMVTLAGPIGIDGTATVRFD